MEETMQKECSTWNNPTSHDLMGALEGSRIWFAEEKRPYRIRARNTKFIVCTKPFNLAHTVLYCVIDIIRGIRGTENLVFGMGAETDKACMEMLQRLGRETEVSYRNNIPLNITRIDPHR